MEKRQKEIRLDGKWRVIRKFIAGDTAGKSMTIYEDYIVEFAARDNIVETHGEEVSTTTYTFNPGTRTIEIQPTTRSRPSPISGAGGAIFHIIPLNDHEIYLRKPHQIETEGDFELILLRRV